MTLSSGSLTRVVKIKAHELGFDFVGVTTPDPPASWPAFDAWLSAGRHGEMAYMANESARERRADPRSILPECRSILVLGLRHHKPVFAPRPDEPGPVGRIAAYAWGEDYHDEIPERLQTLVAFIEEQVGAPFPHRAYTDTGPVLERDIAQRAGLGWIAKNSMLINPKLGSYFFLAELLLGIELEPHAPFVTDHCGTCTRCIEACPTDCILPDRTLDATRCISYLTIELDGPIPLDLRPQMGNWVFGCDVCQEVCPWNIRFAPTEGDTAFAPRPQVPYVDLQAELSLTPEGFNRKFKGSPVKRAKRRGYLRNVAVALGNTADPASIPALRQALLENDEPLVRAHAAWALGRIGGEEARRALNQASRTETVSEVLSEVQSALSQSP